MGGGGGLKGKHVVVYMQDFKFKASNISTFQRPSFKKPPAPIF